MSNLKLKILVSITFFVLLIVLGILGFTVFHILGTSNVVRKVEFHEYQSSRFFPSSDEYLNGVASTSDTIRDGDSIHKVLSDGSQFLVSNFGSSEFVCTGSCFCEEDVDDSNNDRRVTSSVVLKNGLKYLLVAFTSTLAYSQSKEYFAQSCTENHSEKCSSGSIKAEVEKCEEVANKKKKYKEELFWCKGNCIARKRPPDYEMSDMNRLGPKGAKEARQKREDYCSQIVREGEVSARDERDARFIFQEVFLEPTCVETTKQSMVDRAKKHPRKDVVERLEWYFLNQPLFMWCQCAGFNKGLKILNPTVECLKKGL